MSGDNFEQINNQQQLTNIMKFSPIKPHPMMEEDKKHKVPVNCPPAYNPDQTQSVLRRNARERNRVKQVNNSFARLRQHIPQAIISDLTKGGGRGPHKKISKVDTLRIAVEYIKRLQNLLEDLNGGSINQQQPQFEAQNNTNCDSSSNSSFTSSLSAGSSSPSGYTNITAPAYYLQPASPLPTLLEANLQVTALSNNYNNSTTLLSPVSLNSYSPPYQQAAQLEASDCHSPTPTFDSSLSYDTPNFEQAPQQQVLQSHFQQNQPATPPHFDGNFQMKFEPYDNFTLDDEDCTPDDEEILDYISLWQEQ